MEFTTRKPTCATSFPLLLLAGVEGAGKTWAAVEATAIEDVDRAFFIEFGEGTADEYGRIPGARFEIIEHDGTIGNVREAIAWAAEQPAAEGKYNLLILDSMTAVWETIKENTVEAMKYRLRRKGRALPDEVRPDMDLWNRARDVSDGLMQQLRAFPGAVIITARLDVVTAMDDNGNPTRDKDFKVQTHKNVPYLCSGVVQARAPRQWTVTKLVTTNPALAIAPGGAAEFKGFSVPKLFEMMEVSAANTAGRITPGVSTGEMADDQQPQPPQPTQPNQPTRPALAVIPDDFHQQLLQAESAGNLDAVRELWKVAKAAQRGDLINQATQIAQRMQPKQSA